MELVLQFFEFSERLRESQCIVRALVLQRVRRVPQGVLQCIVLSDQIVHLLTKISFSTQTIDQWKPEDKLKYIFLK